MKLRLALATALLAVSTTAAQAADKDTLGILSSVSTDSVQTMSKDDATKTRGEHFVFKRNGKWYRGTGWSKSGKKGWRKSYIGSVYVYYSHKVGRYYHVSR